MAAECFSLTSTTFADACRMLSLCQGLTGVSMSKRTSHHSVDFRKTIATCTGSTVSFAEAGFVFVWVRSKCLKLLEDRGRPWQESLMDA